MGLFGSADHGKGVDELDQEELPDDDSPAARTANAFVRRLMDVGIDGLGPLDSVPHVVAQARGEHEEDTEGAMDAIGRSHIRKAAAGGFLTGVGGLFTLPVALPLNIAGFYVLATRMVASMATLRGYDVSRAEVRSAVLLTLVGADSDDLLRKAGVTGAGRLSQVAIQRLPRTAVMVINKGVGFRLATRLGARTLGRLGRAVPLAGGVLGAGLDGYLMNRIADHAREEFPPMDRASASID